MNEHTTAPSGWYPEGLDGTHLRYWDGASWTNERTQVPPAPAATRPPALPPRAPAPAKPDGAGKASLRPARAGADPVESAGAGHRRAAAMGGTVPRHTWIAAGVLALVLLLSLAGGAGSFLIVLGLIALGTGLYAVLTRRRSWARLPASRPVAYGVLAGGLIVLLVGGGVTAAGRPSPAQAGATSIGQLTATPSHSSDPAKTNGTATSTPAAVTDGADAADSADGAALDPDTAVAGPSAASVAAADQSSTTGTALTVLATLAVKGRAPKTGYDRTGDFGQAWLDVDRNGCDTRNDILARDLTAVTKSGPCKVLTGTLNDRYSGKTIDFVRGNTTSTLVQIDHVVALSDAWQTGAQQLTAAQRVSLANDPLNLYAVDGATNEQKSDGDAATWLPPNKPFRCEYAARQVSVKATYGLWVAQAEHDALARILGACPTQPAVSSPFTPATTPAAASTAPDAAPAPAPVTSDTAGRPGPAASAPAETQPVAPAPAPAPADVTYANCAAARAAGVAPIHRGEPGYSSKLDRDGDGIACES